MTGFASIGAPCSGRHARGQVVRSPINDRCDTASRCQTFELNPTGIDVLVLAGDVTMARHYEDLENVFKLLAAKYRHILYVPGNHEYYKSSPKQVARNLAKLVKEVPEVVIPDNGAVVIAGQRFIGGTMWFRADPMGNLNKRFMNDFSLIEDFEPWVYEQNIAFEKALSTQFEASDVVVTSSGAWRRSSLRFMWRSESRSPSLRLGRRRAAGTRERLG
jgi:hypothetical protein